MIRRAKKYSILLPALLILVSLNTITKAYADEVKYTTTANLNMRTGVGTSNRIILTIPKGRQIVYIASKNGWYQVNYGGKSGYVSSAYVNKTQIASSAPASSDVPLGKEGLVRTTGALNFRTGPDKTYNKVGTLPRNTTISYSEVKNGWYLISYNGKTGYASGRYLRVISQISEDLSVPEVKEATSEKQDALEDTGETTAVKKYYTTSSLNMRTGPSTGYNVVQILPSGAELTYLGQDGWYRVSYNGKTGYASNKFIRVVEEKVSKPESVSETENAVKPVKPTVEETVKVETPTEKATETAGVLIKSEILYTTTTLNMRTGPGTGNSLILTLPKGVHLISLAVENGWHKVSYKGQSGFASGKYLAVNSVFTVDGTIMVNKGLALPSNFHPGENPEAKAAYNQMNQAAKKAGLRLNLFSGYRSYSYQKSLFNKYAKQDGTAVADTYSARPGYSEHQTGLTFDIGGADSSKWSSSKFGDTREGKWLVENAPGYGFILRYPKGKEHITGYIYEPWHFRYVGMDLAKKVTDSGLTLDEYFNVVHPDYK